MQDIPFEVAIPTSHLVILCCISGLFLVSIIVTIIAVRREYTWAGTHSVPITVLSFLGIFLALGFVQNPVPGPTLSPAMTSAITEQALETYGIILEEEQVYGFFEHMNYATPEPGESQLYNDVQLHQDGEAVNAYLHWTGVEWRLETEVDDGYQELVRASDQS